MAPTERVRAVSRGLEFNGIACKVVNSLEERER